jgi:predicted negative regulator of RcsB-dependent stress response
MDPHMAEDEELQKLKDWWKKNGSSIIVGVSIGLAAILGVNGWNIYTANRDETASTLYMQLLERSSAKDAAATDELAKELQNKFDATPYAANGALLAAAVKYEAGDRDGVREMLSWAMEHAPDANLGHAARVRLAYLELGEGNNERALELATVDDPGTFASQYAELRADALAATGAGDRALALYEEAISSLPPGSRYAEVLRAKRNSVAGAD